VKQKGQTLRQRSAEQNSNRSALLPGFANAFAQAGQRQPRPQTPDQQAHGEGDHVSGVCQSDPRSKREQGCTQGHECKQSPRQPKFHGTQVVYKPGEGQSC